jgi:hypothetical protein
MVAARNGLHPTAKRAIEELHRRVIVLRAELPGDYSPAE